MTIKQKRFKEGIVEKIVGLNKKTNTQIAKDSGYSEKTAYSIASENLNKPEIKAEIDKRIAEIEAKTEIDVKIPIENMNLKELNEFLGIMGMGSEYIKYIKENNISLYEQYVNQQKTT